MPIFRPAVLFLPLLLLPISAAAQTTAPAIPQQLPGFRDFAATQARWDRIFLAAPDAKLAGEHLKTLTIAPHPASSPEDYKTAEYVARKFREAGLETEIVPYKVVLSFPIKIHFDATAPGGFNETGPTPEHVGDPSENDPRILPPFNSSSASGDITADLVYANYGRPEDFKYLTETLHIDLKGKLLLVRYGTNFRGVKAFLAQQYGAAGILIYSDPTDDGYILGDVWPKGPWRPDTGVQRGSVGFIFEYPGDPTTPGFASTPDLPDAKRIPLSQASAQPRVLATAISSHDAAPLLQRLQGPGVPRNWQGGLPFTYHVGPGPVRVHLTIQQSYDLHTIWDVIGKIPGTDANGEFVVAGNHRDAWVYGATDPSSGTAAMLESVHGLGALLKQGWKPRRTIYIGSWDAEEEGLIGSTEWAEQHAAEMDRCVAYFNVDVAVSGPDFSASAVPTLKQFMRDITKEVPTPQGNSLYSSWQHVSAEAAARRHGTLSAQRQANAEVENDVHVGDLGSGSDYSVFLQHLGVPSTDFGSGGPGGGVYHSTFDNFAWYTRFADPDFKLPQQQARVFGLEVLHMADADVLPYDDVLYAKEIGAYLESARLKASQQGIPLDWSAAATALQQFSSSARDTAKLQQHPQANPNTLNTALRKVETDLLDPEGLPHRPWYRHVIYAPGEYTGYDAVVLPHLNEALDKRDGAEAQQGLNRVAEALQRAAQTLSAVSASRSAASDPLPAASDPASPIHASAY
jgi:N-acetylated-alpha-linked acidic dipeptidase